MGLAVDGLPFLGAPALLPDQRDEVFRDILGWEVDANDFGRLDQFKIFKLGCREQPDVHWTDEQVKQYTAGVIYGYLGGLLFPDTSGRYVTTDFVPLLEDFDHTSKYSWGSAVLARLYSSLCRTSLRTNDGTRPSGCVLLLQLWAWARFLPIRPVVRDLPNDRHGPLFFDDPHGARWRVRKSYAHTARNNGRYFRDQFDGALYRHVDWEPYDVDSLPAYCKAGQRLWSFEGIIIYRWHVEPIMPRRFARQFGKLQTIPELPYPYGADNHKCGGTHSRETLSAYIHEGREDRYNHVVLDQMEALPSPRDTGEHVGQGYRDWFAFYGRRLIRNPAHHHDNGAESSAAALVVAVNTMTRVRDLLEACPGDQNNDAQMILAQCRDTLTQTLEELARNNYIGDEDEDERRGNRRRRPQG
ncbi:unnamed protein product [Cuscuta campestris]|uniref:Aminotransferase-like plant mobile domain-containing protein n=1 Tax=Cuscuta campestris TaxID=132261 RepID=A0A484KDC8_9ASTE|nr:unnamed protein product [Cuscuta campestris]